MTLLPPFPTDDETLDLLDVSLAQGCPLSVLELLSGYDETRSVPTGRSAPSWAAVDDMSVYSGAVYHWTDVVSALVAEVRSLRNVTGSADTPSERVAESRAETDDAE